MGNLLPVCGWLKCVILEVLLHWVRLLQQSFPLGRGLNSVCVESVGLSEKDAWTKRSLKLWSRLKTKRGGFWQVVDNSGSDFNICQSLLNTDLIMCELGEYVAMQVTEKFFLFLLLVCKSSEWGFLNATLYAWSTQDVGYPRWTNLCFISPAFSLKSSEWQILLSLKNWLLGRALVRGVGWELAARKRVFLSVSFLYKVVDSLPVLLKTHV